MVVYSCKRNIFEPESVYELDGEGLSWTRQGKPTLRLSLADITDIRLAYADGGATGTADQWVATIRGRGGAIKASSVRYLGVGRIAPQQPEFFDFLRTVQAAVQARAGAAPRVRTGDPLVMGLWVLVLGLAVLFLLLGLAVLFTAIANGHWSDAVFAALLLLLSLWAGPVTWRSVKANRARAFDLMAAR